MGGLVLDSIVSINVQTGTDAYLWFRFKIEQQEIALIIIFLKFMKIIIVVRVQINITCKQ